MQLKSSERRLKLILMLQQSKSRITVAKLAEKFNVTERTIYRDFNALSDINVPVTWDKYIGYGVVEGYSVPPLMFTSKELAVIMIGLNFAKSQVDKQLVEDAEGVELKIKEVLPQMLLDFMKSVGGRTIVDPYLNFGKEKEEGGNWYDISSAIAENQTIQFDYQRSSDKQYSVRRVDPYLLVFYGDHWNLIGYSHKRKGLRNFILNQISNIKGTGKTFLAQKVDIENLIYRPDELSYDITVNVNEKAVDQFKANLPAKVLKIKKKGKNFIIRFKFDNLDYINNWLLQFIDNIIITAPIELKQKRITLLNKMIKETDLNNG